VWSAGRQRSGIRWLPRVISIRRSCSRTSIGESRVLARLAANPHHHMVRKSVDEIGGGPASRSTRTDAFMNHSLRIVSSLCQLSACLIKGRFKRLDESRAVHAERQETQEDVASISRAFLVRIFSMAGAESSLEVFLRNALQDAGGGTSPPRVLRGINNLVQVVTDFWSQLGMFGHALVTVLVTTLPMMLSSRRPPTKWRQ
jgi:hypothetical protein